MFIINEDGSIYLTRGDIAVLEITAGETETSNYTFRAGDVVRFKVFEKKRCDNVVLCKDTIIGEESEVAVIKLTKTDTKLGDLINKPTDYWYEVELNPDTSPQTIIGYDADGPKIFRLFPEGDDVE